MKYWQASASKCLCGYPLYGSPGCVCPKCHRPTQGNNRVITREFGDIPDIAKPFDVFKAVSLEEMQKHTAIRAETFCHLLNTCAATEFKNHPFHRTDVVLSVLHNPSSRVRNSWDWDFQG